MKPIEAYPLTWPAGWDRTPDHERTKQHRLKVTEERARNDLLESVRILGGKDIIISTNKRTRRDGLPMLSDREPADSGVAVYWTRNGKSEVMACDCWSTVRENMRSIGLAVDGLRAISRSGASQILDRAFTGFAALPMTSSRPSWRSVLGYAEKGPLSSATIKECYRHRVIKAHPDHGGTVEALQEVQAAYDEAMKEFERDAT